MFVIALYRAGFRITPWFDEICVKEVSGRSGRFTTGRQQS
jgi:hypothetical protein